MEKMWGNKQDENDPMYRYQNEGLVAFFSRIARDKGHKVETIDTEYETNTDEKRNQYPEEK